MIVFITTVRHPDNCSSYDRIGRLLDASLRSVCRQVDADFRVVVVHNSMPKVTICDQRITYVRVDFPAPSAERTPRTSHNVFRRDKGTKCAIGVAAAHQLGADHVMFFDADDLIHHQVSALANGSTDHPGWYSPQGWIHSFGSRSVQFVPTGFHQKNGSTSIIRTDLVGVPTTLATTVSQEEVLGSLTEAYVDRMLGEHGWWQDQLETTGHKMEATPFPIAVWEIGTGENVSGNLVSNRQRQRIDADLHEAFGMTLPSLQSHVLSGARTTVQRVHRRLERRFSVR